MRDFQRFIKDPFADKKNVATFIAEQKEYLSKPYKKPGFRWPHLDMFKKAQEAPRAGRAPRARGSRPCWSLCCMVRAPALG